MLKVEGLTKLYTLTDHSSGGVRHASFDVNDSEFFTLLGPSGCGKTTTLRSVAGLEEPSEGRIVIDNRIVFESSTRALVPANQRNIGMVFQSYAVWPHMTVFENVAFPLRMSRMRRYNEADIKPKVVRILETMELAAYAKRSAAQLSGGQQQRLSLARALVAEPQLLLLDEPLSNLDALLRDQMRSELRRVQKEVRVTAVYVTHDQSEALALSDRLAIMREGLIVQIGTPKEVYYSPADTFVATFIGRSNLLSGTVAQAVTAKSPAIVQTALGPLSCTFANPTTPAQGAAVLIRPEHVQLAARVPRATNASATPNQFHGVVANAVFLGETTEYLVRVAEASPIVVRTMTNEFLSGEAVTVTFPPERTLGLPAA